MTLRRPFPLAAQRAIIARAAHETGQVHCEQCGILLKSREEWEIDHVIAEAIRPAADKSRRLTAADGQLLCKTCHRAKTGNDDSDIARAKRREAADFGAGKPKRERERRPLRVAAGTPQLMRRGFVPAGDK